MTATTMEFCPVEPWTLSCMIEFCRLRREFVGWNDFCMIATTIEFCQASTFDSAAAWTLRDALDLMTSFVDRRFLFDRLGYRLF